MLSESIERDCSKRNNAVAILSSVEEVSRIGSPVVPLPLASCRWPVPGATTADERTAARPARPPGGPQLSRPL